MANLGGNLYCNLNGNGNGDGSEGSPYTAAQLSGVLAAATDLVSDCTVFLYGTKTLAAGQRLDLSTPNLNTSNPALKLLFKKKGTAFPIPGVYSSAGGHVNRSIVKVGGGNATIVLSDLLMHVRGDLNGTLEGVVEVVGSNTTVLGNVGLVANNLSNFKLSSGGGGCGCCGCCGCGGGDGVFTPVLCATNDSTKLLDSTVVIHAENPEILVFPENSPKFHSFAGCEVILGNVAYTELLSVLPSTQVDANFFFKVAGTAVTVIDIYSDTVLRPEGLVDVGDFSQDQPLLNVTGNFSTLDLNFGPGSTGKGPAAIPVLLDMDDSYPLYSTFGNVDAGYFCDAIPPTSTGGDVAITIGGENVVLLVNLPDAENQRSYYAYIDEDANLNIAKKPLGNGDADSTLGEDANNY